MKKTLFSLGMALLLSACGSQGDVDASLIKVGVFEGNGGAQTCIWETVQALKIDPGMTVKTVTTGDMASGALDNLDALIIPGGGGARQYLNLGAENHERILDFVRKGKGVVGICAGAYLFSDTPDYGCLHLNGAMAIDREHDNRGHGMAKFTLTDAGLELFPELKGIDTCYVYYYEGPVLVKGPSDVQYEIMAEMQSDVHEEGNAPANMTNNRPFFIANTYGQGRVFSSIAHPEATPGMRWLIPRMVRWVTGREMIAYGKQWVAPHLFDKEHLFSYPMLRKESSLFDTLLYGSPDRKIAAMDWLQENLSWDAKRWIQGLVFDSRPEVRLRAFRYIVETEYTQFEPELLAAIKNETDADVKAQMDQLLRRWR